MEHLPLLTPEELREHNFQVGYREGLLESLRLGIAVCLRIRFGPLPIELSRRIELLDDPKAARHFLKAIETAPDLDALKTLLPPPAEG